jgi:hypothetical protein
MIKCFLSLLLLICCSTFIDLHMLNQPCIPGMRQTWLWFTDLSDVLLEFVCHHFIEDFCICVH